MPKIQYRILALYFLMLWLIVEGMGCSVWMAWNGKEGIDPKVDLHQDNLLGLSQQEIEAKLGRPSISEPLAEGKVAVTYKYGVLKRPDRGRAVVWFLLDVLSLGFWELLSTPYEYLNEKKLGEAGEVTITYGADYRVEEIGGYQPDQTELVKLENFNETVMNKGPLGVPSESPEQIKELSTNTPELGRLNKSDKAFSEERPITAPLADPKQTVSLSLFVTENVYMPENDRELFLDRVRRGLAKEGFTVTSNGDIKIIGKVMTYAPQDLFTRKFGIALETGYFNSSWVALDKDNKEFFKGKFEGTFQLGLFNPNDSMPRAAEKVIEMLVKAPQ